MHFEVSLVVRLGKNYNSFLPIPSTLATSEAALEVFATSFDFLFELFAEGDLFKTSSDCAARFLLFAIGNLVSFAIFLRFRGEVLSIEVKSMSSTSTSTSSSAPEPLSSQALISNAFNLTLLLLKEAQVHEQRVHLQVGDDVDIV